MPTLMPPRLASMAPIKRSGLSVIGRIRARGDVSPRVGIPNGTAQHGIAGIQRRCRIHRSPMDRHAPGTGAPREGGLRAPHNQIGRPIAIEIGRGNGASVPITGGPAIPITASGSVLGPDTTANRLA